MKMIIGTGCARSEPGLVRECRQRQRAILTDGPWNIQR
jgi:hypothetical protein